MIDENAVIGAIAALLDDITDVAEVHEGIPNSPAEFPYISIRPSSWTETFADLRDTEIEESFIVSVYQNLDNTTLSAQTLIRSIVHQIHEILGEQSNITLGNLIDYSSLTSGTYQFDQKNASLYYCDIEYKAKKKFNRFA